MTEQDLADHTTGDDTIEAGTGPRGHVHGYTADKDAYLKRLRRVEGQVRGLQRLIEEDRYCIDVLTQISATTRALQGVALALMDDHLRHCVAEAAVGDPADAEKKLAEASATIRRLVTS